MKHALFIMIVILFAFSNSRGQNWIYKDGPTRSNNVRRISAGGTSTVYAVDKNGFYKSTDGAATWSLTSSVGTKPQAVGCNFNTPDSVFVAVSESAFVSTNGGSSWNSGFRLGNTGFDVYDSYANRKLIYIGLGRTIAQSSIYMTADGHATEWQTINYFKNTSTKTDIHQTAMLTDNTQKVWVCGAKPVNDGETLSETTDTLRGVFYTADGSNPSGTWYNIGFGKGHTPSGTTYDVWAVGVYDSGTTIHIFAGMKSNTNPLWHSSDNGATWTHPTSWGLPSAIDTIYDIKTVGKKVYLATDDGFYVKSGAAWNSSFTKAVSGMNDFTDLAIAPADPTSTSTLYTGTSAFVFKTTDDGTNWTDKHFSSSRVNLSSVSAYGSLLLTLSSEVPSAAKYNGSSWTYSFSGGKFFGKHILIDPCNSAIVLAAGSQINPAKAAFYRSGNSGDTFDSVRATSASSFYGTSADPLTRARFYGFGDGANTTNPNFWVSGDSGLTWPSSDIIDTYSRIVFTMATNDTTGGDAQHGAKFQYAGLQRSASTSTTTGGVWKSRNHDSSFTNVGLKGHDILSLALNANFAKTVYAGGSPGSGNANGMWISLDSSANWTALRTDTVKRIVIDPRFTSASDSSNYFFILSRRGGASRDSVFRSTDAGSTWTNLKTPSLPADTINDLRSDPSDPSVLYVSTSRGVYVAQLATPPVLTTPVNGATNVSACPPDTLAWNAVTGADSYHLQFGSDPNFSTNLVDINTSSTSYTYNSALNCNTTYYWRLNSTNGFGTSKWTSSQFTTGCLAAAPALSSPANNATGVTICNPVLSWSSVNYATYQVQVATDTNFIGLIKNDSARTATLDTLGTLTCSVSYYWRVRSINCKGPGAWATYRKFTTGCPEARQSGPLNNTTNLAWCQTRDFDWSPYFQSSSLYDIQLDTSVNFNSPKLIDTTRTTFVITMPANKFLCGATYYWRVRAQTCAGTWGPWPPSNYQFTTASCTPVITLTYPYNGQTRLGFCPSPPTVHWTTTACTDSFRVQVATTSDFSSGIVKDTSQITTTLCSPNVTLLASTTYYWHVIGHNVNGNGAWSTTFNFQTGNGSAPAQPETLVSPCNGVNSDPNLVWRFVPNTSLFRIQVSLFSDFHTIAATGITADTTWFATGLADNTTYYWHVRDTNCNATDTTYSGWCNFKTLTHLTAIGVLPPDEGSQAPIPKPTSYSLAQNYPNPFNPTTKFEYTLPSDAYVALKIYNVLGQSVATVVDEYQTSGYKSVEYDASRLSSGIYFYRLSAGSFTDIKKMILLK